MASGIAGLGRVAGTGPTRRSRGETGAAPGTRAVERLEPRGDAATDVRPDAPTGRLPGSAGHIGDAAASPVERLKRLAPRHYQPSSQNVARPVRRRPDLTCAESGSDGGRNRPGAQALNGLLNVLFWCRLGAGCYSRRRFGGCPTAAVVGSHSDRLGDQTAGGNPALAGQP